MLNHILQRVSPGFEYWITNTVNCRPQTIVYLSTEAEDVPLDELQNGLDYEIQDKNREPDKIEMELCRPHIDELVTDFQPHGVVYLGKVARSYKTRLPKCELLHPAFILRLEFKLQKVLQEAQKLSKFVKDVQSTLSN